jgi:hypothetical protein
MNRRRRALAHVADHMSIEDWTTTTDRMEPLAVLPHHLAGLSTSTSKAMDFQATNQPVISVDTKKKELMQDYKNPGQRLPIAHGCTDASVSMISPTRSLARSCPTGSRTLRPMMAASASASTTTRPNSRSIPSAAGMTQWAAKSRPADDPRRRRVLPGTRVRLWKIILLMLYIIFFN